MGIGTSAVVAMADDGGSTGDLREAADVTPPGDVRKCLAAFAADPNDPLVRAFKYRFEFANNHTLGNLMIAALEDATGSFPQAISLCENLLHARGHVYPSTLDKIVLCGRTRDGQVIEGQALLSHSRTALESVWLKAPHTGTPYPGAIKAICEADLIVLGPGSLFTSIIPNLLVPGVLEAISSSRARILFVCSLADLQGETWGLSVEEHVTALENHGLIGKIDYVLTHSAQPITPGNRLFPVLPNLLSGKHGSSLSNDDRPHSRPVALTYDSIKRIEQRGIRVVVRDLADKNRPTWHNPEALRNAFSEVQKLCLLPQT